MQDEISLVDLLRALVRQRFTIIAITIASTLAAGAYAFVTPMVYRYHTALEVGSYSVKTANGLDRRLIEPSESIERKLRLAYIPLARSELGEQKNERIPRAALSKEASRKETGSRLFVLVSEGTPQDKPRIAELHQRIADLLIQDNNKALQYLVAQQESRVRAKQAELDHMRAEAVQQATLKSLEEEYRSAQQKLASLDQDYAVKLAKADTEKENASADLRNVKAAREELRASVKRLEERERLLRDQIAVVQKRFDQLQHERDAAVSESAQNANAVAVLMVGGELAQTERNLWGLRSKLEVNLKAERMELERKLTENQSREEKLHAKLAEIVEQRAAIAKKLPGIKQVTEAAVERLRNEIAKGEQDNRLTVSQLEATVQGLESELADMTPTKSLYVAVRDIEPENPSTVILLGLGALVGLILGTLAALIADALRNTSPSTT